MKFTITLFFLLMARVSFAGDIVDDISTYFKSGNVSEISKYLSSNLELNILDKEGVYTASQAQLFLKDFFAKYPPKNVKIIHKVVSNPSYKFGVILFNSTKGIFRISLEIKNINGNFSITQIRIEENKD